DGRRKSGETEDDPRRFPQHFLAIQPRRGYLRQCPAVEEPAVADVFDAAVGGRAGWQEGGGLGRNRRAQAVMECAVFGGMANPGGPIPMISLEIQRRRIILPVRLKGLITGASERRVLRLE